jgi:hypothetical protein
MPASAGMTTKTPRPLGYIVVKFSRQGHTVTYRCFWKALCDPDQASSSTSKVMVVSPAWTPTLILLTSVRRTEQKVTIEVPLI